MMCVMGDRHTHAKIIRSPTVDCFARVRQTLAAWTTFHDLPTTTLLEADAACDKE